MMVHVRFIHPPYAGKRGPSTPYPWMPRMARADGRVIELECDPRLARFELPRFQHENPA
jgi:hypothetical protein